MGTGQYCNASCYFLGAALDLEIRSARVGDVEQLVLFWQDLVAQTPHLATRIRRNRVNRAAVANHLLSLLDHEQVVVGAVEGQLAGYVSMVAHLTPLEEKWAAATISDLYVQPIYRGKGIGKALVNDAIARIRARGLNGVTLQVNPQNTAALALYHRLGFECAAWSMALRFDPTGGERTEALAL
jgi:ribosomal protein S18 acetylase RimI-like enzyme